MKVLMDKTISPLSWLMLFFAVALSYNFFHVDPAHGKSYCERLYDSARKDYYSLLESERKQRFHDSWEKVIGKFDDLVDRYPECSRAPDALFNMGVLYQKLYRKSWLRGDLTKALESFRKVAESYPKNSLADDALFAAAGILEEMGDKEEAYEVYSSIRSSYSKGDMAKKAGRKLTELADYAPRQEPVETVAVTGDKVNISDIKYWSNPDYTRVVVYGSGKMAFSENQLKKDPVTGKPPRLYVDIMGAAIPRSLCETIPIADGLLLQARVAQYNTTTVRLVLDIDSMKDHRVFSMENPSRLVIDVMGEGGKYADDQPAMETAESSEPLPLAQQFGLSVQKIVLDPGHGGRDPGAVGPNGLKEKDVTLALALRLKPILEERGYQILMTRQADVYVGLEERTAMANDNGADLFISIHTNASRSRKARGVETYFLGVAKTREASETAMLENAISQQALSDLEKILLDLTRTSNLKQSSVLAESIQDSLYAGLSESFGDVRNLGVKQASFYVLIGARMPSVLVETSFISNPGEEKLLSRKDYRDTVSQSLLNGIIKFVRALSSASGPRP
ncbi:MAG: N-acetylmuramoyl-L-alanine amidase [bacterium]|nr:N-acetylmuramoyl-L-alanine amidase [bacterium]MDT8396062.1 N-acetylmuramoyl-L-alanine amidase [bacterium]